MKTMITSNSRPLCRALCTLLLGITVLWVMPVSARAQLYVSQLGNGSNNNGSVGEYDAAGHAINASFITGLTDPNGLALSGDNLKLFVAITGTNTVAEYDATMGTFNTNLITPGLNEPVGLALSGDDLFVTSFLGGTVGEYNFTAKAFIANFITGLNHPWGLALSGNNLFVANNSGGTAGTVGKYDATTGHAISTFIPITGVGSGFGLALSGNNLFVANASSGTVGEYDATTGDLINPNFITNVPGASALALSGKNLWMAYSGTTVGEYDITRQTFNANFITGLTEPVGLAVVPEPSTWAMLAMGGVALLGIMHRKKHRTA